MAQRYFRNFSPEQEAEYRAEHPEVGITEEVVEMIRERSAVGLAKYGVSMDRTDLVGSEWCQHAIEEMLDGVQYLMQVKKRFEDIESNQVSMRYE